MGVYDATMENAGDEIGAARALVSIRGGAGPRPALRCKRKRSGLTTAPQRSRRARLGHPLLDRRVKVLWDNYDTDEASWYEGVVIEHVNWHEPNEEPMLRIRYDDGQVKASNACDVHHVDDGAAESLLLLQVAPDMAKEELDKEEEQAQGDEENVESKELELGGEECTGQWTTDDNMEVKTDMPLSNPSVLLSDMLLSNLCTSVDPASVADGIKLLKAELQSERSLTPSPTDEEVMEMLQGKIVTSNFNHGGQPNCNIKLEPETNINLDAAEDEDEDDDLPLKKREIYQQISKGLNSPSSNPAPSAGGVAAPVKHVKKVTWHSQLEQVFMIPARPGASKRPAPVPVAMVHEQVFVPLSRGACIGMLNTLQKTINELGVNIRK